MSKWPHDGAGPDARVRGNRVRLYDRPFAHIDIGKHTPDVDDRPPGDARPTPKNRTALHGRVRFENNRRVHKSALAHGCARGTPSAHDANSHRVLDPGELVPIIDSGYHVRAALDGCDAFP